MNKMIYMLEDDSDDRYLTEETLSDLHITVPVKFFSNRNDLISALSDTEKPSVILVDYNTTPDNGVEVLRRIKKTNQNIPVVILSDSDLPQYRNECYANGANTFIKKPGTLAETKDKIGAFFKYWLDVAEV
jgi:CheY-like chemotaxis protein